MATTDTYPGRRVSLLVAALIASSVKALLFTSIAGSVIRSVTVSPIKKSSLLFKASMLSLIAVTSLCDKVKSNRLFDKFAILVFFIDY